VLELVLTDESVTPRVELLEGPRVRLTMSASEQALSQLHQDEVAPSRVFVRDAQGAQVITTIDPCTTYGSQAIVRS
jgi:hypothetical protein